jgi:hypothetical protein
VGHVTGRHTDPVGPSGFRENYGQMQSRLWTKLLRHDQNEAGAPMPLKAVLLAATIAWPTTPLDWSWAKLAHDAAARDRATFMADRDRIVTLIEGRLAEWQVRPRESYSGHELTITTYDGPAAVPGERSRSSFFAVVKPAADFAPPSFWELTPGFSPPGERYWFLTAHSCDLKTGDGIPNPLDEERHGSRPELRRVQGRTDAVGRYDTRIPSRYRDLARRGRNLSRYRQSFFFAGSYTALKPPLSRLAHRGSRLTSRDEQTRLADIAERLPAMVVFPRTRFRLIFMGEVTSRRGSGASRRPRDAEPEMASSTQVRSLIDLLMPAENGQSFM